MKHRLHISLSIVMLLALMIYASAKSQQVRLIPFEPVDGCLMFNARRIYAVGRDYIEIDWKNDTRHIIRLSEKSPLRENDVASMKLKKMGTAYILEEFHLWEPVSHWYIKAFSSAVPMMAVVFWFLRDFEWQAGRFIFRQRKP